MLEREVCEIYHMQKSSLYVLFVYYTGGWQKQKPKRQLHVLYMHLTQSCFICMYRYCIRVQYYGPAFISFFFFEPSTVVHTFCSLHLYLVHETKRGGMKDIRMLHIIHVILPPKSFFAFSSIASASCCGLPHVWFAGLYVIYIYVYT